MKQNAKRRLKIPKRVILTAVSLLTEAALVVLLTVYITKNVYWAYMFFEILSIFCTIYIVNKKGDLSYKLAWIIFILTVPFAGWLLYLIFGGNRIFPYLKKRFLKAEKENEKFLLQDESVMRAIEKNGRQGAKQAKYLYNESRYPLYYGGDSEFYPSGEAVFAAVLDELGKAEDYIFIEFFILAEGYMWDEIHKILKKKAESGVDVRIIFDDFGSANRQYDNFAENLREEGMGVSVFNPIKPDSNLFLNNRLHRKMIVIDGKTAFTGGFNIADEYINRVERFGHWLDCGIKLEGEAVSSFVVMFVTMWNFVCPKAKLIAEDYLYERALLKKEGGGFYQPYCDGPFDDRDAGKGIYLQMINSARSYVYIATPYLILDSTMSEALCRAAKSGIDVRIITPKKWDKWYVHPVTQYYYSELFEAGVRIYEYTPGFIHSKLFVADDRFATVGTFNMDYRSFYFHFELGVWLCETESVGDIKSHMLETMDVSEEINSREWAKRPFRMKAKQYILHLFAPFM